ncbi:MAG: FxDxF family PEP-CTERM protein [Sphingomonadaceae bacterium]
MKYGLLGALGIVSAAIFAPSASAAVFTPADPNFTVVGDINSGPISAFFGNAGIAAGNFQDTYLFTIDQFGTGSGSVTTSTTLLNSSTDLDLISVFVNGLAATKVVSADGLSETFSISNVPIFSGVLNTIEINGLSRGQGSYGGQATFLPIPEPGTWALMIAGFGLVGFAMRKQRTVHTANA